MKLWNKLQWYESKAFIYLKKGFLIAMFGKIPNTLYYTLKAGKDRVYVFFSNRRKKGMNKVIIYKSKYIVSIKISILRKIGVEDYKKYKYKISMFPKGIVVDFKKSR